jgi:hypothetical protein
MTNNHTSSAVSAGKIRPGKGIASVGSLSINTSNTSGANMPLIASKMKLSPRNGNKNNGLSLPPIPSHHPSQGNNSNNNQHSFSDGEDAGYGHHSDGCAAGGPGGAPMVRSRSNKNMTTSSVSASSSSSALSRARDMRSSFPSSVAEEPEGCGGAGGGVIAAKMSMRKNAANTMKKQRSASFSKANNTYRYKVSLSPFSLITCRVQRLICISILTQ